MGNYFVEVTVYWLLGALVGVSSTMLYIKSKQISPFEDSLQVHCVEVGSTLKHYTLEGELTCENGAKFDY